jgi:hypothetical protein
MKEALSSSETSVLTIATLRNIPFFNTKFGSGGQYEICGKLHSVRLWEKLVEEANEFSKNSMFSLKETGK